MRPTLVSALGVVLAVACGLIVGEYPFTGVTPWLALILVPAVIGFALVWAGRDHPAAWWVATGVLAGASLAWAVWISTGRGDDPWPAGGWLAVGAGTAWPLLRAAWLVGAGRRRAHP